MWAGGAAAHAGWEEGGDGRVEVGGSEAEDREGKEWLSIAACVAMGALEVQDRKTVGTTGGRHSA